MMYNNIALLVGHMVGDYLFQNHWMAVHKSALGWRGTWPCFVHCTLYSLAVAFCVGAGGWTPDNPNLPAFWMILGIAFVTHYPIDRLGLAGTWMRTLRQTQLDDVAEVDSTGEIERFHVRGLFWAPVYIVVDNTLHLVLMWVALSWLGN